jgi:hypothetical protein
MFPRERWMVDGVIELERLLPGFDPMRMGRVESIHLELDGEALFTVRIGTAYCVSSHREILLELTFYRAREVTIPVLGSLDLSELEVRDISDRQLEGIQREVINHGPDRFSLLCRNVEVTQVRSRDGEVLYATDRL